MAQLFLKKRNLRSKKKFGNSEFFWLHPDNISQMNYLHKNIRITEITAYAKLYKWISKCHSQTTENVCPLLIIKPATMTQIYIYIYRI